MSLDPVVAQAMLNVLTALRERGTMPSRDVQLKATAIPAEDITFAAERCRKYHLPGSNGERYMVAVALAPDDKIIDAECSCKAGSTGHACKHALRVLAHLNLNGFDLS